MKTTLQQLAAWIGTDREGMLEFKEAKTQFDLVKLMKYCVAIANEGGGKLVLGVTDRKPRVVVGSNAFQNLGEIQTKILDKVHFRVVGEEVAHPEGRVVVFHIPCRPAGTAYQFEGAYLMRSGENLVAMSEDQLRAIFDEGKPSWLRQIVESGLGGLDVLTLLDTQIYFDLLKQPFPGDRQRILDKFVDEGLIVENGGKYDVLNIGALLFAKDLKNFGELQRRATRVIVYDGNSKLRTREDKIGVKGYVAGFQGLIEYINAFLPSNEVIEGAIRRTVKMYPEIAIRELVANALVHQDFATEGTTVLVEVYNDRMEISNPGKPPIPADRFIDEYRSRNEIMAGLMRRLGICEAKGSGIDKVIANVELFQLPAPDFRVGEVHTSIVLYAHKALEDMDSADKVRACYQHCVLRYVMNQKMSNQTLRERFNLPEERADYVSRIIRDALDAGLIKYEEPESTSKRYARYVPYWA